jgi:hypothetical protein
MPLIGGTDADLEVGATTLGASAVVKIVGLGHGHGHGHGAGGLETGGGTP